MILRDEHAESEILKSRYGALQYSTVQYSSYFRFLFDRAGRDTVNCFPLNPHLLTELYFI